MHLLQPSNSTEENCYNFYVGTGGSPGLMAQFKVKRGAAVRGAHCILGLPAPYAQRTEAQDVHAGAVADCWAPASS